MEALENKLSSLSIARRSVTSDPLYLLDLSLPPRPGAALAVSCSDFTVHLHDTETLRLLGSCGGHGGPICRSAFTHQSANSLYSASSDGTVRLWDVRCCDGKKESAQIFRSDASHSFCSFDLSCNDSLLCAGTEQINGEDSFLVFWDARRPGGVPLGVYSESHSDDVTQVRFHPTDKDRLASGSTDGLVNVFDLTKADEEEALAATCNSESSASAICWTGEGHAQLLCVSHDEGLKLWDLGSMESEEALMVFSTEDARSSVQGDSAVDYLVGGLWLESERQLLVLGGSGGGDVHLLTCDSSGLRLLRTLSGGHRSTVRCFGFDPETHSLFTGGEDGLVLRWSPGAEEEEEVQRSRQEQGQRSKRESMKSESVMRLKSRPHKKHQFNRDKNKT